MTDIRERVEPLALKVFQQREVDLIELKVNGHHNDILIQITVDKPAGGITIEECVILNKTLAAAIEQENILSPDFFSLELSSPGLDRPLVTPKDFLRSIGKELHFWLREPINGKKEARGTLIEAGSDSLVIEVKGGFKQSLPFSSVIKGKLVIE